MARRKRRHFSGAEKVAILKRHFMEGEAVSAICVRKLNPTVFYEWQRKFFENGAKAFEKDERRDERKLEERNQVLEARLKRREEVIAELMTEHLALKKSLGED